MASDFFALLGEPRRPWLDPQALKEKYHRLASLHHPDIQTGESPDFADINRAYQTLAEPAPRLRHFLELETPSSLPSLQAVPEDIAAFFAPVAEARQAVDLFFKKHAAAASPLAKALLSTEGYQAQERIQAAIAALQAKEEALLSQLREADALWQTDRAEALRPLPNLWQSLGYIAKWLAMLREALFQLASL
jgi:curved DNA-binding protein CbpA